MSPQVTRSDFAAFLDGNGEEARIGDRLEVLSRPIRESIGICISMLLCCFVVAFQTICIIRKGWLIASLTWMIVVVCRCTPALLHVSTPYSHSVANAGPVMLGFVTSDGPAINAVPHYWVLRSRHPLSSTFRLMAIGVYHRGLAPSRIDPSSPQ